MSGMDLGINFNDPVVTLGRKLSGGFVKISRLFPGDAQILRSDDFLQPHREAHWRRSVSKRRRFGRFVLVAVVSVVGLGRYSEHVFRRELDNSRLWNLINRFK